MSEDYVEASQEVPKRRRRHRRVVKQLACKKADLIIDKVLKYVDHTAFDSTAISACTEASSASSSSLPLDFSEMYGNQESDEELNTTYIDIVDEVRRAEVANRSDSLARTVSYSPVEGCGNDDDETFVCAKEWLEILGENQTQTQSLVESNDPNQTVTTETQILKGCQEEDGIENLAGTNIIVPMNNNPLKEEHSFSVPNQRIAEEFKELCSPTSSSESKDEKYVLPEMIARELKVDPAISQTFSKKINKQQNVIEMSVEDTRSSFSSELSVQSDEIFESSPREDFQLDLNKSIHISENIKCLTAFFSQYFTQEQENKKNEATALTVEQTTNIQNCSPESCRELQNFDLHEKSSSEEDFLGFSDSEIQSEPEFIQDHQMITPKSHIYDDMESVTETANKTLNTKGPVSINDDGFKNTMAIQSGPKDEIETEIFITAEENYTLKFSGFQSASGKAIQVSQEAEQKMIALKAEFESWTDADMCKHFRGLDEYTQLKAGTSTACGQLETNPDCRKEVKTKDMDSEQRDVNIIPMCAENLGNSEDSSNYRALLTTELTNKTKRSFEDVENIATRSVENAKKPRLSVENQKEEDSGNVFNKNSQRGDDKFGSSCDKNLLDFVSTSTWHMQTALSSKESLTRRNSVSVNISDDEIEYLTKLENEIKNNKLRRRGKLSLSFSQRKRKYSTGSEDSRSLFNASEDVGVPSSIKATKSSTNIAKEASRDKPGLSDRILSIDSQEKLEDMITSYRNYLPEKHRTYTNLEDVESKSNLNEKANRNQSTVVLRRSRRIMSKLDTTVCSTPSPNTKVSRTSRKNSRKATQDIKDPVATQTSAFDNASMNVMLNDEILGKLDNTNELQPASTVLSTNTNRKGRKPKKRSKRSTNGRKTQKEKEISDNLENENASENQLESIKHTNWEGINISTKTFDKLLISDNNNDQDNFKNELDLPQEQQSKIERKLMSVENLPQIENKERPDMTSIKYPENRKKVGSAFSTTSNFVGFQRASGKKVNISAQALEKARVLYNSTAEPENMQAVLDNANSNIDMSSEKELRVEQNTISAPPVSIAEANDSALFKSEQCIPSCSFLTISKIAANNSKSIGGFQCASGKGIKISTEALQRAQAFYQSIADQDEDIEPDNPKIDPMIDEDLPTIKKESESVPRRTSTTTSDQCGKGVQVSSEALQTVRALYESKADPESIEMTNTDKFKVDFVLPKQHEFQEKEGWKIAEDISKVEDKNERTPDFSRFKSNLHHLSSTNNATLMNDVNIPTSTHSGGFQCASGKGVKISSEALERARMLYERIAETENKEVEPNLNDDQHQVAIENMHTDLESDETVENVISHQKNVSVSSIIKLSENQAPLALNNSKSFAFSTEKILYPIKQRKISSDLCLGQVKVLECNETDSITPLKMKLEKKICGTPDLKEFFNSVETSTPRTLLLKSNFSLTQEVSSSTAALLHDKSDEAEGFQKICWEENEDSLKVNEGVNEKERNEMKIINEKFRSKVNEELTNLSNDVRAARQLQRQKQLKEIQEKNSLKDVIMPGYLFVRKTNHQRMSWSDVVGDQNPQNFNLNTLDNTIFDYNIRNINFFNAANFEFNGKQFYDCICTAKFIPDQDDACIIPSDSNTIGLMEIESGFLAMRGVCPDLVPKNWIKHHYKMILLKLSLWEKWFPSILDGQLCTPSNIIQQLKYRYDREIDHAERSILKKIFEGDESPAKRMVLLVINIYQEGPNVELELTDWWYTIRTTIDLQMANLIKLGKVRIGTKLMIQGAEILNCVSACSPLEASPAVRLKIHTNSTRRTKWDVKLGLFRISSPFITSLNSVHENGGSISRLSLFVVRVYPLVYFSKEGELKGVHSEKIEMRLRKQEAVINFNNFELLVSQVQKEMEQERKEAKHKCANVCDFSNASALYKLIEDGYDLENIEIELSPEELERLKTHQQEVLIRKNEEIQRRVKERMSKQKTGRSSTGILKIRIVDARNFKCSAILSIWEPDDDLLSMFHEGVTVEVTNCTPTSVRNDTVQLRSSKSSGYKTLERYLSDRDLLRSVTELKDMQNPNYKPMFNEVDLIGLVVSIDSCENQKFQSVFISDAEANMVCIQFWNGIKTYGYEDVLQNNQFICAFNLEWRTNSSSNIFPTVFVTEICNFTDVPKTALASEALEELKNKFKTVNLAEVFRKCYLKIEDFKRKANPAHTSNRTNVSTWNDNTLHETSTGSLDITIKNCSAPSLDVRIGRLLMYGTAPDISPIAFHKCNRTARKGFKPPKMVDENKENK